MPQHTEITQFIFGQPLSHYEQAVEVGRRAWALNPNWAAGLRYVVAGLGQLDRIEEVQTALCRVKEA
jgi:hypothetical protein